MKVPFVNRGEIRHSVGQKRAREPDVDNAAACEPRNGCILPHGAHDLRLFHEGPIRVGPQVLTLGCSTGRIKGGC